MEIGIFDALRIYRNPLGFYVRVEKDCETGKYGVSFCINEENDEAKFVRSWTPFTHEVLNAIRSVELLLRLILIHGHRTYLEKDTYLFNHYNEERMLLTEEDVLTEDKVNTILFNLTFQAMQQSPSPFGENSSIEESEVLVGTIVPQDNKHALLLA